MRTLQDMYTGYQLDILKLLSKTDPEHLHAYDSEKSDEEDRREREGQDDEELYQSDFAE